MGKTTRTKDLMFFVFQPFSMISKQQQQQQKKKTFELTLFEKSTNK
jgi:hypothetical protein